MRGVKKCQAQEGNESRENQSGGKDEQEKKPQLVAPVAWSWVWWEEFLNQSPAVSTANQAMGMCRELRCGRLWPEPACWYPRRGEDASLPLVFVYIFSVCVCVKKSNKFLTHINPITHVLPAGSEGD